MTPTASRPKRISLVWLGRAFVRQVNQWREGGISRELIERFPELHVVLGMDSAYPAPSTGESPLNERVEPFMKLGQDKFAWPPSLQRLHPVADSGYIPI